MFLRKIRIVFAVLFFACVTFLFLDFTGAAHEWFGWSAKVQFIPALLATNFVVLGILAAITLIFGRIYCSVICPLGVLQDAVSHIAGRRKKNRFSYRKQKTKLRAAFLLLFVALLFLGFASTAALIAPYSAYGRIATAFFAPIWAGANNILAFLCEGIDSYAFYSTEINFIGLSAFVIAALTFIIVGVLAWKGGRTYCNTVCPVGTILGFLAKFSLFKPVIDKSKCVSCGLCARNCKGQCINVKEHSIDYSRCVDCFDCIGKCKSSAISYSFLHSKNRAGASQKNTSKNLQGADGKCDAKCTDVKSAAVKSAQKSHVAVDSNSRRGFFFAMFSILGSAAANAQEKIVDGGLTPIKERVKPKRKFRILPAGAKNAARFEKKCTACQLCVSACPSKILKASSSLKNFMQPEISYEDGHCQLECVECSKVCPANAIEKITPAQKSSIQIGIAVWNAERCIVNVDKLQCDNCFRQCPTGAIQMVQKDAKDSKSLKIPVVNESRCIGCGACENLCPARPISAITVMGNSVQELI